MFSRILLGLLVFTLISAVAPASEAFPGLKRKWRHYQSPNFELYSARSDTISRDLLERMELLRALFLETFKLPVRMPQPVTIFAFDSTKEFKSYIAPERRGTAEYAGFCLADPDRTVITLAPAEDADAMAEVVYHEYIHCLFHVTEENPPVWFNEGVAELLSTIEDDGKWLVMGTPILGRVLELRESRLMPFEHLFAITHNSPELRRREHTGLFYSQSWAFLHYLQFGQNKIPPEKISLFLRAAGSTKLQERPEDFRTVFADLLGKTYAQAQRDLETYIRSGSFRGRRVLKPVIAAKQSYAVRPADSAEMYTRLAELSVRFTGSAYANLALRNQLEQQPDVRLHEMFGGVALRAGEPDVAREHWLQANEMGTTNVAVFRELSRLESNRVFSQFNLDYRLPEERAARLRQLLDRSIAAAPDQHMGYEMLAWVEATAQQPRVAEVVRVQERFNKLADRPRTLLALVLVRMRLGQREQALELLKQMDRLEPNDWARHCAEITLARLENRPVDPDRLPKGTRPGMVIMPPRLELAR